MQSDWIEFRTAELIERGFLVIGDGYRAKNSELAAAGLPFARAGNINDGFRFEGADRFPASDLHKVGEKVSRVGDVVFTSKGTVGRFAYVNWDVSPFVYSPQLCYWRSLNTDVVDSRFLFYWIQSSEFWLQAEGVKSQTDMADYVSLRDQRRMSLTLPPIDEQRTIGRILGALDDKIEHNRKMNRTLEAMGRTLFKSWFVDFDPVTAKAAGRKPYGMNEETAALFPAGFVESELGLIPESWRVGTLCDVSGFLNGFAFKSSDWVETGVPVVKIGSVKPGVIDISDVSYVSEEVAQQAARFRLKVGDLLVGMTGYVGEVGMVPPTDNPPLLNQRVGKFVLSNSGLSNLPFIYCLTRNPDFKAEVEAKAHGTAQANVSSDAILGIKTVLPDDSLGAVFSGRCLPMLEKILSNVAEAKTLAALRDMLLPKLLSGEIRVRQAENLVAEAV